MILTCHKARGNETEGKRVREKKKEKKSQNPKHDPMPLQHHSRQRFSEHISQHILFWNMDKLHITLSHTFTDEMVSHMNVLGAGVMGRVLG